MIFHSRKEAYKWADRAITKISRTIYRTYPGGFVGQEDLAQAGWIGFCRSMQNKSVESSGFYAYAYSSIKRAIQEEQLKSVGILCFSHNIRRLCMAVHKRISVGEKLSTVLGDLNISNRKWSSIKILLDKYFPIDNEEKNNYFNLQEEQEVSLEPYLSDLLDSECLSDTDKELLKLNSGEKSRLDNCCRTKMWKLRKNLEASLERSVCA